MSNAPSEKGIRIITAPINWPCVKTHECFTSIILTVFTQDFISNYLLLATIDSKIHREWELITTSRGDYPTTAELITFLESRCTALKLLQATLSLKLGTVIPGSLRSAGIKVSKPFYCNVATQLQCSLCNGAHRLFYCDKFRNASQAALQLSQAVMTLPHLLATIH